MFKLNAINNESSLGNIEVGNTHEFRYDGTMFYFGSIHSSRVKSINVIDGDLEVTTNNSVYIFVKVKGN